MHHQFEGRVHLKQESVSLFTQPNAIPKIQNSKMTKVVHYIPSLKLYTNFLCEKDLRGLKSHLYFLMFKPTLP